MRDSPHLKPDERLVACPRCGAEHPADCECFEDDYRFDEKICVPCMAAIIAIIIAAAAAGVWAFVKLIIWLMANV